MNLLDEKRFCCKDKKYLFIYNNHNLFSSLGLNWVYSVVTVLLRIDLNCLILVQVYMPWSL